jgi:hypothetical protein
VCPVVKSGRGDDMSLGGVFVVSDIVKVKDVIADVSGC